MKDKELRSDIEDLREALFSSGIIYKRLSPSIYDNKKYGWICDINDIKNKLDALCEYLGLEYHYERPKNVIRKIPKQKKVPSGFKLIDTL